jgi:hypothetical protein
VQKKLSVFPDLYGPERDESRTAAPAGTERKKEKKTASMIASPTKNSQKKAPDQLQPIEGDKEKKLR